MNVLEKIIEEIEEIYIDDVGFGVDCNLQGKSDLACDNCYECMKDVCKNIIRKYMDSVTDTNVGDNDGWISVEERLPEEHKSMFAKLKGTHMWNNAMFEKVSDEVNVTIELEDGTRKTTTSHTLDGKWKVEKECVVNKKVIAWRPLPEPYKPKK